MSDIREWWGLRQAGGFAFDQTAPAIPVHQLLLGTVTSSKSSRNAGNLNVYVQVSYLKMLASSFNYTDKSNQGLPFDWTLDLPISNFDDSHDRFLDRWKST